MYENKVLEKIKEVIEKYPNQELSLWTGRNCLRLYNKNSEYINLKNGFYEGLKIKEVSVDPLIKEIVQYYRKYNFKWQKYIKSADLVAKDNGEFGIMIYMNDLFYEEKPNIKINDIKRIIREALQLAL